MSTSKMIMSQAANQYVAPTYIEDVFSTYLYTGNGSTQTITNGIDLAGEGGLVWIKDRVGAFSHNLADTERGANNYLFTDSTQAQFDAGTARISSFNSDGFSLGSGSNGTNASGNGHASWTFRKAPRFFDVVTYTGNGVAGRQIAHNLGQDVGCIVIKRLDSTGNWPIWHRGAGHNGNGFLNANQEFFSFYVGYFNSTAPTDSVFTVGVSSDVNASGGTYVAYIFAHDPLGPSGDGSDGLIACGSYTKVSGVDVVDLGWEPQWVLLKNASVASGWQIADNMRGWVTGSDTSVLSPNTSAAEGTTGAGLQINANGFQQNDGSIGNTYIYIAIRRGPMRAPTSGTEVFAPITSQSATGTKQTTGFPVDMQIQKIRTQNGDNYLVSRITGVGTNEQSGEKYLITNSTAAEASASLLTRSWDNTGYETPSGWNSFSTAYFNFRRAPGFFDAVAYTGNGVAGRTVSHNLGVAPELMIVKGRTNTANWVVYHSASGATQYLRLNTNNAAATSSVFWNNTAPTDTEFTVGAGNTNNASGVNYIAYLFGSAAGVSKVGSYTGNGSSQTIDCGFTAGARFVLTKRISSVGGNWFVWDTARGIVVGNEPYLGLNLTTAETTVDYIDPDPAGFKVINANTNNSGDTYIFYAIA